MDRVIKPDFHGVSDPGHVRRRNEDQFLIAELSKSMLVHQTTLAMRDSTRLSTGRPGYLFVVADGLGGAPEGARASRLAVDQVIRSVLGTMPWFFRLENQEDNLEGELKTVFEKCQRKLKTDVREHPSSAGMGTTLTMAYVLWPRVFVVHAGDARCYLLRGERLDQVTHDHTLSVPILRQRSRDETLKRVLWNVIGGNNDEVWPEVYKDVLVPGDALLLATDGLSRELSDEEIRSVLLRATSAKEASIQLSNKANEAGGRDNITVLVARFPEADALRDREEIEEERVSPTDTTQILFSSSRAEPKD